MLVDTSVLVRALQPHHPLYPVADRAIRLLPQHRHLLHIFPQNLIELWTVATRPSGENGLGLAAPEAALELERVKSMFLLMPETPAIYPAWEELVFRHHVRVSRHMMPGWWPRCAFTDSLRCLRSTELASGGIPIFRL